MATAQSEARSRRLYSIVPLTSSVPLTASLHAPQPNRRVRVEESID
jgi:hypothetical protein